MKAISLIAASVKTATKAKYYEGGVMGGQAIELLNKWSEQLFGIIDYYESYRHDVALARSYGNSLMTQDWNQRYAGAMPRPYMSMPAIWYPQMSRMSRI